MKKFIAEFLGTYALVFAGTGAIIIDQQTHGVVTHVGIAVTFGLVIMSMIYAFGDICGASMNPTRSLAPAVVSGHSEHLWLYLVAPICGAVISVPVYRLLKYK